MAAVMVRHRGWIRDSFFWNLWLESWARSLAMVIRVVGRFPLCSAMVRSSCW